MSWIVVRNTGDKAYFERGLERKEGDRPNPKSQHEFRELFTADSSVEDETISKLTFATSEKILRRAEDAGALQIR